jgi:hypothetical protein
MIMISDWSWERLKGEDVTSSGLSQTKTAMKPYINELINRIDSIQDDEEAIMVIFNISRKVARYYNEEHKYYFPEELGRRLNITLKMLLKKRLIGLKGVN